MVFIQKSETGTFLTLAEKSVMILRMLLVSVKSLQTQGSSAHITRMAKPGPASDRQRYITISKTQLTMMTKTAFSAQKQRVHLMHVDHTHQGKDVDRLSPLGVQVLCQGLAPHLCGSPSMVLLLYPGNKKHHF